MSQATRSGCKLKRAWGCAFWECHASCRAVCNVCALTAVSEECPLPAAAARTCAAPALLLLLLQGSAIGATSHTAASHTAPGTRTTEQFAGAWSRGKASARTAAFAAWCAASIIAASASVQACSGPNGSTAEPARDLSSLECNEMQKAAAPAEKGAAAETSTTRPRHACRRIVAWSVQASSMTAHRACHRERSSNTLQGIAECSSICLARGKAAGTLVHSPRLIQCHYKPCFNRTRPCANGAPGAFCVVRTRLRSCQVMYTVVARRALTTGKACPCLSTHVTAVATCTRCQPCVVQGTLRARSGAVQLGRGHGVAAEPGGLIDAYAQALSTCTRLLL